MIGPISAMATYRLPKREEYHKFDADDLHSRPVLAQLVLELNVELHQTEHGNSYAGAFEADDPNVRESRVQRMFAVSAKHLRHDRDNGEQHPHQTILEDARPDDVEPSKTRARLAERPLVLASSAFLHEEDSPEPVDRRQSPEVIFLLVQPRRNILAHERKEARNGESFVAVAQHLVVDCVLVVEVAQERHRRVNWDHKQNADDVALLVGHEVVRCMPEDEVEGYED